MSLRLAGLGVRQHGQVSVEYEGKQNHRNSHSANNDDQFGIGPVASRVGTGIRIAAGFAHVAVAATAKLMFLRM